MKINVYPSLLDKLNLMSSKYNIEIGGYLMGEVKNGEILLQDILIPSQTISTASVEINPKHQVELLKKYGPEKCKKILGHWHSHHSMGCFWSGQDVFNMDNIMEYKDFFVFIVSSKGNHLIKVKMNKPFILELNNVILNPKSLSLDLFKNHVDRIIKENTSSSPYDTTWPNEDPNEDDTQVKQEDFDEDTQEGNEDGE